MHEKATPRKYFLHRRDSSKLLGVLVLMLFSSTLLMPDSLTSVPSQKCHATAALVGLSQTQP